jgi:lipid-A-disaccharide synthase
MSRIFVSVGEASGDLHASNLIKEVTQSIPNLQFYGMGGQLMRQAGANVLIDSSEIAVIGGVEILVKLPAIFRALRQIKQELSTNKYDLLILVDYPGFNLKLAKIGKQLGIRVLYYISPQIWAWHQSRIKKIKKYVDRMVVMFPFEVDFYRKAQIPVSLVVHPLLDKVRPTMEIDQAKEHFALDKDGLLVGLFPGSRGEEIKRLFPVMLQTAEILARQYQKIQFIVPLASSLKESDLLSYADENEFFRLKRKDIFIIKNDTYDVANVCDVVIAKSGTVTLELALLGKPMVIIYKMSPITYWLVRMLIKVPYVGLCNIVAGKKIVQELIQTQANPQAIAEEVNKIIEQAEYRQQMVEELNAVKNKLQYAHVTESITQILAQELRIVA